MASRTSTFSSRRSPCEYDPAALWWRSDSSLYLAARPPHLSSLRRTRRPSGGPSIRLWRKPDRATPTVLLTGPYRFFFFSSDRGEPIHVHVQCELKTAKFWLGPVRLAHNHGFA